MNLRRLKFLCSYPNPSLSIQIPRSLSKSLALYPNPSVSIQIPCSLSKSLALYPNLSLLIQISRSISYQSLHPYLYPSLFICVSVSVHLSLNFFLVGSVPTLRERLMETGLPAPIILAPFRAPLLLLMTAYSEDVTMTPHRYLTHFMQYRLTMKNIPVMAYTIIAWFKCGTSSLEFQSSGEVIFHTNFNSPSK